MAKLNRSNDSTNLGPGQLTINQGQFRSQQDVVGDSLLQLGGRGEVQPGNNASDPLNAPFVLYVNPYIGRDDFVFGSYSEKSDTVEAQLKRIELQRLSCGYTEAAPFKTINRAVIEAGLITSKSYLSADTVPFQRVCIVLSPGTYDLLCGPGKADSDANFPDYADDTVDDDWLTSFNPETVGGIILPRGCSVVSLDLRKTILRPAAGTVPATADEAADYSNRRTIFRVTGEGYYYGLTFMDTADADSSHHLMSCFEFSSQAQTADFYDKIERKFGSVAATNVTSAAERTTEWEIVGPQPAANALTQATDTTASASPYIYNCSIRSEFGLCGIFANGANVGGFRSMVIAQFTGVSLQNDYSSWQEYVGNAWVEAQTFTDYRATDPDDIRMKPERRSFHIRAVNRAVIQEVSVFAIGQGVHHWTESGGELTVTNSNSNFGGVAALSEGYQATAPLQDKGFSATHQRVPSDLSEKRNNIRRTYIGTISVGVANDATTLVIDNALSGTENNEPEELGDYTLVPGSQLWIESPTTADYRAPLAATAWDPAQPNSIVITTAVTTDTADGEASPGDDIIEGGVDTGVDYPDIAGRRVYIRRLIDTRTQDERRYSLLVEQPNSARRPQRDYILRTEGDGVGNASAIDVAVLKAGTTKLIGQTTGRTQLELKQINPNQAFRANGVYRPGDSLTANNKHYICTREATSGASISAAFLADNFEENYVHMQTGNQGTGYMPEDFFKNVQPILIFDHDSDQAEASNTLGWVFDASDAASVWRATTTRATKVQAQYKSATDYRGLERYLTANSLTIANPQLEANRDQAFGSAISNQEFRRPSIIRMYGHAYEWAGFGNYTKGLPQYQGGMAGSNKFTYYGTSELGGRVYFTGFNEEGFSVSPRGVEDIQTGEVLAAEEINAPDADLDIPTFFDRLRVNNLEVLQSLELTGTISGDPTWEDGVLPESSTDGKGIIETATVAEAVAGTDDERAVTPLGVQARVNTINDTIVEKGVPSGTIMWHCAATAPDNWLVCDGSEIPDGSGTVQGKTTDFSDLFAALAGTYGDNGGNNLLPDLQGTFVRGWTTKDTGAYNETPGATYNPDPSRDRGTIQGNALEEHSHNLTDPGHAHAVFNQLGGAGGGFGGNGVNTSNSNTGNATTGITIGAVTGATGNANESRPTNIALLPIIKI